MTRSPKQKQHLDAVRDVFPSGEGHPNHKLTADDVASIRLTYETGEWSQRQLAAEFNVWQSTIQKVLTGKTWQSI